MNINFKVLGEIIKDRRKEMDLTQQDLASKMGVTQAYVSALELGKYDNLTMSSIGKIADSLNICYEELLLAIVSEEERAQMVKESNALYEFDDRDAIIMAKLKSMTEEKRKILEYVIDAISEKQ